MSLLFWLTAVCTPAGSDLLCSCEKGYVWPREKCLHSLTCQEHEGALSGRSCSCLKGLPPQGPFCQLSDGMQLFFKYLLNGYSTLPQANVSLYCLYSNTNETVTFCPVVFSAYITLKIKVRLNIGFQEDLKNSSSALYRSYKTDLERAVGLSCWSRLPKEVFRWSKRSLFPWTGCLHVCNLGVSEVMQTHLRRGIEKYSNQRAFRGQDITLAYQLTLFHE